MKTTIKRYIKYVEDRVRSSKAYCFEGEHAVRKSIASYNASGRFFFNSDRPLIREKKQWRMFCAPCCFFSFFCFTRG